MSVASFLKNPSNVNGAAMVVIDTITGGTLAGMVGVVTHNPHVPVAVITGLGTGAVFGAVMGGIGFLGKSIWSDKAEKLLTTTRLTGFGLSAVTGLVVGGAQFVRVQPVQVVPVPAPIQVPSAYRQPAPAPVVPTVTAKPATGQITPAAPGQSINLPSVNVQMLNPTTGIANIDGEYSNFTYDLKTNTLSISDAEVSAAGKLLTQPNLRALKLGELSGNKNPVGTGLIYAVGPASAFKDINMANLAVVSGERGAVNLIDMDTVQPEHAAAIEAQIRKYAKGHSAVQVLFPQPPVELQGGEKAPPKFEIAVPAGAYQYPLSVDTNADGQKIVTAVFVDANHQTEIGTVNLATKEVVKSNVEANEDQKFLATPGLIYGKVKAIGAQGEVENAIVIRSPDGAVKLGRSNPENGSVTILGDALPEQLKEAQIRGMKELPNAARVKMVEKELKSLNVSAAPKPGVSMEALAVKRMMDRYRAV